MPIIEVRGLVKRFGDVLAVDDISFSIPSGICFGLLGPNGAGKTTTVEILEGIIPPSSGEILFAGRAMDREFRQRAGIMFQTTALQDFITVRETLQLFSQFYDTHTPIEYLIEKCALGEFLNRDTKKLSGGQRQRLLLAIALVNDPDIVFLDEPTTGLDPQARRNFWQLVDEIKSDGKTVVLTTHYMDEARVLCDELIFMDHGKIIATGSPRELLASSFDDVILEMPAGQAPGAFADTAYQSVQRIEDRIEIYTSDVNQSIQTLLADGASLADLRIRSRTLEDLFIELTGKELRS